MEPLWGYKRGFSLLSLKWVWLEVPTRSTPQTFNLTPLRHLTANPGVSGSFRDTNNGPEELMEKLRGDAMTWPSVGGAGAPRPGPAAWLDTFLSQFPLLSKTQQIPLVFL